MTNESSGPWDAIVVGSGATGGIAAWKLASAGYKVLLLEAGSAVKKSEAHAGFLRNSAKALYRHLVSQRQDVQKHHPTYWATNPDFFIDDKDNPYTTPEDMPFRWIRGRRVGGRTLTWDAVTPRLSDYEFKAASQDGFGVDWPISHADLAPFYGEIERLFGIYGTEEGLSELPDGVFHGHKEMTPGELHFKASVERNFPERHVIMSRGVNAERRPEGNEGVSRISSTATTIRLALLTGNLTLRTNSAVARVLTDDAGLAAVGVEVVDTVTKRREEIQARAVFLCASTIESVRLLLNSKTPAHPRGLGGNSGVLGRYLMDHSAGNVYFTLPDVKEEGKNYEFSGCASIMIPRYQNLGSQNEAYLRGFGVWGGIQRMPVPNALRRNRSIAFGFLCGRSEVLPHYDNRVEIHPQRTDSLGIPIPHIICEWKPEDIALAKAARHDTEQMVRVAGGVPGMVTDHFHTPFVRGFLQKIEREWTLSTPGMFVHEVGGARMGLSPDDSVVDPNGAVHGIENLFVTDGACWVTSGWQNPTLTEMAITLRAATHAVETLGR